MNIKVGNSVRGVHFGGDTNNRSNAGFVYSNSNNTPSNANANIRSRRCYIEELQPYLLVKNLTLKTVVGKQQC